MRAVLLGLGLAAAVSQAAEGGAPAPARIENPVKETALAMVQLTSEAERRLGIVLAEAALKKVAVSRRFGGDVMVPVAPPGAPPSAWFPLATSSSADLLRLCEQQVAADGEVERAKVQVESTRRIHHRAERLVQGEAGSVRAAEEAAAQVRLAEVALEVARARRLLLGAPVAEAIRDGKLWVRVPVYAGELRLIDTEKDVRVGDLSARPGDSEYPARPVSAPPSASAASATVDLFYEVAGAGRFLRPGQRVSVRVPLRQEAESLTVPWASVVHDVHGNTWVYESPAPQTFTRRRVQVTRVVDGDAVLVSGPQPGTRVVVDGAAELFGTEFGGGK